MKTERLKRSMKYLSLAISLVITASFASAQGRAHDKAELIALEERIGEANIHRDKAFFQRVEADEFVFTDSSGGISTKAEDVASLDKAPGETRLMTYELRDLDVRIYGKTAVVLGKAAWTYKKGDREIILHTRFTDVFVKKQGSWQIVAGHSSRIPDKPAAAK